MDEATARAAMREFLDRKEALGEGALAIAGQATHRIAEGWVFFYNSRGWVENGDFSECLVGQGPVIILDDGRILEGGSLEEPGDVIRRCG
jgi:hypothetical protein